MRQAPRTGQKSDGRSLPREAITILIFGLGIFTAVSLLTYHPNDPSLFTATAEIPRNACGKVGAFLSSILLECFGIGAFLVPAIFMFVAAVILRREGSVRLVSTLGGMAVAMTAATVFLTIQWKYWSFAGGLLLTGGAFGAWFAELLARQFNSMGASIVSLVFFLVAIAVSTPLSVAHAAAWAIRHAWEIGSRVAKLLASYAAYLLGMAGMRAAHAMGDWIQRGLEATARRAKERAAARRAAQALEDAREREAKLVTSETSDADVLDDSDESDEEAENQELQAAGSSGIAVDDEEAVPARAPIVTEAPNVLPELGASVAAPSLAPQEKPPEIVVPNREAATEAEKSAASRAEEKLRRFAARAKRGAWKLPSTEFLVAPGRVETSVDKEKLHQNAEVLRQKFLDFEIPGEVIQVRPGPVITLYEFKPGPGIRLSKIAGLQDDISMALASQGVRIIAPIPGKAVVGIEIPSEKRQKVYLREFFNNPDFRGDKYQIPVVMGKDIGGGLQLSDLARMPHLLCAGTTGSGKSVFMNGLICSLLYRFTPDELRMILVDPKFIEFNAYQDIPHLLLPVVDDAKNAATALKWAVREMDRRYRILQMMGAKNLAGFNQKVEEMGQDVVRDLLTSEENQDGHASPSSGADWLEAFEPDENGAPKIGKLPYIVIVIDELADLMMVAKKEVELSIARIAQKARAAGIHLVIATQRPSTDVITGLIKANLPSRMSFQLASYIDSKTILDRPGAERLLGQGDMLFIPPGLSQPIRLHGAYLGEEEIGKITAFLKSQGKPVYRDEILVDDEDEDDDDGQGDLVGDEKFDEAVELIRRTGTASASFLQRHLGVGYNRAAKMIESMESRGIVGPANGAKPREVLLR